MKYDFAITPRPNDVFTYYALISGEVENELFNFTFSDIEKLNKDAFLGIAPITKLSFAAFLNLRDKYELLDAGSALGIGTGPVLVSKNTELDLTKKIAVPGINTTANLLLNFYAKQKFSAKPNVEPLHFREIIENIALGKFESGVLIHEGRFVFEKYGLHLLADLGAFWESTTSLPVPLGCICIRKDLLPIKDKVEGLIRKSLKFAFDNPEKTYPMVAKMAQYLSEDVLKRHIYAFVNDYSFDISQIRKSLLHNLEKCL